MNDKIKKFVELLLAENQKQNLVSRKAGPDEMELHIQDSLQVLAWFPLDGCDVIDIGSGAGFPGLVLAIECPECRMTLVESDLKKSGFLQQVSMELGLKNVRVIRSRVETLGQNQQHRDRYDLCTSRAVAAMRVVLEYGIPLVKLGGRVLLWKGSSYQQEISEAQHAMEALGGEIKAIHLYNLMQERDRAIVAIEKVRPTPEQFPRRTGTPTKKPL
jgi:16S rRNA (guanine527-N7)-methyltransferase